MTERIGICRITYIQSDGSRIFFDAPEGHTVMTAALRARVPGIEGKCRGNCSCVTCHVYIEEKWTSLIGTRSAMEESMLDFADDVTSRSRLGCQIPGSAVLDGLEVYVPDHQRILGF
jgi:2Fe-2S ferredoxin